jgi:SAM-dependent methyltransferase
MLTLQNRTRKSANMENHFSFDAADKQKYWNAYYSGRSPSGLPLPSQFAVFVAGELHEKHHVIDIGCGGGRDSFIFDAHGHSVVGVDGSMAAVESCVSLAKKLGSSISFMASDIDAPDLADRIKGLHGRPTLIYARFFLHALTDEEEASFLNLARAVTAPGDTLALEFRTMKDVTQHKVTGAHYRRFIDSLAFLERASAAGFKATYFVEGFGFAKYKTDDAHVARIVFSRV